MKSLLSKQYAVLVLGSLFFAVGCGSPNGMNAQLSSSQSAETEAVDSKETVQMSQDAQEEVLAALRASTYTALTGEFSALNHSSFSATSSFAPRSIQIDETIDCPDGGSLSIQLAGSVDHEFVQGTSISVDANIESGSLVANNCSSSGYLLNADVDIHPTSIQLDAELSGDIARADGSWYTGATGSVALSTPDGQNFDCDLDIASEGKADGSVSITNRSGSISVTALTEGELCGQKVDHSVNETINF